MSGGKERVIEFVEHREGFAVYRDSDPTPEARRLAGGNTYRLTVESARWWHGDEYEMAGAHGYPGDAQTYETGKIYTDQEAINARLTGKPRPTQAAEMTRETGAPAQRRSIWADDLRKTEDLPSRATSNGRDGGREP